MAKKTIVHVLESLGAGTLTSSSQICNLMAENGADVHLIYSPLRVETPEDWQSFFDPRIKVHRLDMSREVSPKSDFLSFLKMLKLFYKLKPDIIHLHCSKAGFLGRLAAFCLGKTKKVFYSPRGFGFLQLDLSEKKKNIYFALEWFAAKLGGRIVACSNSELEEALRVNDRSMLIENAIDGSKLFARDTSPNNVIRVGTLGRMGLQKNPEMFLNLARSFSENPNVKFVWVGGGDADLEAKLKLEGVEVTGWVDRTVALRYLSDFDVYLQTSLWEGMPLSVIESQIIGIPAVVTNVIGNRDVVIEGVTGFICDDFPSLKASIQKLVDSEELRHRLSVNSIKESTYRFSMKRLESDYLNLYFKDQSVGV